MYSLIDSPSEGCFMAARLPGVQGFPTPSMKSPLKIGRKNTGPPNSERKPLTSSKQSMFRGKRVVSFREGRTSNYQNLHSVGGLLGFS